MKTTIKQLFTLATVLFSAFACNAQNSNKSEMSAKTNSHKKVLVAYFSRADENYNVGYIKKGNTEIVAEIIAEKTNGTLFKIERQTPYPADYKSCVEEADKELENQARPPIKGDIQVEDFDVIFLGYPNWWGTAPMPVYTFVEKHKWHSKIVIPFCTHEGSGLGSTVRKLATPCAGATFLQGLAIQGKTAQTNRKATEKTVNDWLGKLSW